MVEDADKQTDIVEEVAYKKEDLNLSNSFVSLEKTAKTNQRLSFTKT